MENVWSWLPWAFIAAVVMFGLGWMGASIDLKRLLSESRALPKSYFKGVNFLLNEEPDKAIDALQAAAQQHPEAVELQFALGSLFRKRGEIDRALRVHQALSEKSGLSQDERATARYETALDYHRSGLLDHAEQILIGVLETQGISDQRRASVLGLLLNLYQQERNWRRAIDVASELDAGLPQDKRRHATEVAHFYCELAEDAHTAATAGGQQGQHEATRLLDNALSHHSASARAHILKARWQLDQGDAEAAIATTKALAALNPGYMGLAAEIVLAAYDRLGRIQEGLDALSRMQSENPSLDMLNVIFKATMAREGPVAATQLVKQDLARNPTLVGLDRLIEAEKMTATDHWRDDLELVHGVVHSHASRLAVYLCGSCGFKAKQWVWHCPACNGWESFPPRRTAEYDTAERHLARLTAEHIDNQKGTR